MVKTIYRSTPREGLYETVKVFLPFASLSQEALIPMIRMLFRSRSRLSTQFSAHCFFSFLFLLFSFSVPVTGEIHNDSFTPDAVLRVTLQNLSLGGIQRPTTMINGTVPGPQLRIAENKVAWIRVYNDMEGRNLTMHWHGLAMAAYPFSDGTPLASQWPIPPGHFFDYQLHIPSGSAGTYFYHSHIGFQTVSCSGPLIIEDEKPPYKVDGDRTVYLQELFNKSDSTIEEGLQAIPFKFSGETNGFIINGKTISNFGITNQSSAGVSIIRVKPDSTYRMRFIGAHSLTYAALGIEDHDNLRVIEADGSYTKEHPTKFLQLASGQRFSTLLTSKKCDELQKSAKLDYYLQVESRERPRNTTNYAILRYENTCNIPPDQVKSLPENSYPTKVPVSLPPLVNGFLDYELRPLQPNDFPSASQVTRRITIDVQQILNKWIVWRDSNITWTDNATALAPHTAPERPYLVSLYENAAAYLPSYEAAVKNGGVDPSTQTFPAKIGEVLEIVFQNVGAHAIDNETGGGLDVHPFHAHGQHYYDIGGGSGAFDAKVTEEKLKGTEPVLRDTTMLFRYNATTAQDQLHGWRAWRLRVEQPGVWMIHCHTLQHMIMGMQTVWIFGNAQEVLALPKAQIEGYLSYGGSAYGNSTHAPEVVRFDALDGNN